MTRRATGLTPGQTQSPPEGSLHADCWAPPHRVSDLPMEEGDLPF